MLGVFFCQDRNYATHFIDDYMKLEAWFINSCMGGAWPPTTMGANQGLIWPVGHYSVHHSYQLFRCSDRLALIFYL